jgi:two-component system, NtrC family, sensor kinase
MMAAALAKLPAAAAARLRRTSVGAKLFTLVLFVLVLTLGLLGWANVRLHRRHLDSESQLSAERLSNVIVRSIGYSMLHNDRDALERIIESVSRESEIRALRIVNHEGRIAVSMNTREKGRLVRMDAGPLTTMETTEGRVLRVVTPIRNSPSCSSGLCHAHPASQQLLGALDAHISLARVDRSLSHSSWQFTGYSAAAIALILICTGLFVWRFVHQPVTTLRFGTDCIRRGELGVQIPMTTRDELGALANSFNEMSRQLLDARNDSLTWAQTLEERVAEKTDELERAHRQMLQAEKLTSLGKLAAVVAHEINNPLSGILTYARLLRKWIDRGETLEERGGEMREALDLIASESRRCGEIVQNLLAFSRVPPLNITDVDVNEVVRRCLKLIEHKLELGNIVSRPQLARDLPHVRGDAGQIEQLLLALVMNAIEAMVPEGTLDIRTIASADRERVTITIEDDGTGIPESILPRLFEPFVTTKEARGVGLGLAVSRSVVDRHHGKISVESAVGRGTKFTIELPVHALQPDAAPMAPAFAGGVA